MSHAGLELILVRNAYYKRNYRRAASLVLGLLVLIAFLVWLLWEHSASQIQPKFFPANTQGVYINMPPLTARLRSDEYVLNWVKQAIARTYALDYVNFRRTLRDARDYFTPPGYDLFLTRLQESNNLKAITEKKAAAFVGFDEGAHIVAQKEHQGSYRWKITMPVTYNLQNSKGESITNRYLGTIWLRRISTLQSPSGLAIERIIVEERK